MALSIKSIPVLQGDDAERFELEAAENAKLNTPQMPQEVKKMLQEFLQRSKSFCL